MESVARGGTRWKRFAVVMVPTVAATAAIGVAQFPGARAASLALWPRELKFVG
ncbi:cholesterol esterase, partial [Streptomyces albidoflavus]